jgi:hypothetical protein
LADTKISAETDAGTLDGTEIVPVVKGGANRRTTTQAIANRSGGGLFGTILSPLPTIANTGFSTWLNQQSATIMDGETGLILAGALAANHISGRTRVVPGTPYNIDVLLDWESITNNPTGAYGPMIGWTDGTKIQAFTKFNGSGNSQILHVLSYATVTSGSSAAAVNASVTAVSRQQWLRIGDDVTNVHFALLPGGSHSAAIDLFTVAKASGYLGASGYSSLFFGINRNAGQASAVLQSYTQR